MYCKNCGMNNNEDSKFCMGCGAPLQTGEAPTGNGQPAGAQEAQALTGQEMTGRQQEAGQQPAGQPPIMGQQAAGQQPVMGQQPMMGQPPVMRQPMVYTRSELGISTAILGAAMYFMGLFSGYLVLVLLAGYVLIREKDSWLRYVAVKSVVIAVMFSVLSAFVGLVPDFLDFFASLSSLFHGVFTYGTVSKIIYVLNGGIDIVRTIVFLVLGFKALGQRDARFGMADKQAARHIMEK